MPSLAADPPGVVGPLDVLRTRIEGRTARVAVVGLGYVGLPLAVELAKAGFDVSGIDTSAEKVAAVEGGRSQVEGVTDFEVAGLKATGKLRARGDYGPVAEADVVVVCVPTPLNKTRDPDVSFIVRAAEGILEHLHGGQLVILESTTYPGTTEELVRPLLEGGGLSAGADFHLAFSPERVDPGNRRFTLKNTAKVVGGVTPSCTEAAALFYRQVITDAEVVQVSSTQTAEMAKLLENTFRTVNIALVNEVAMMCDRLGIDVWEVIDAAATKPFGFMAFYPGPGLGGHCLPIDPHYLAWKLRTLNFHSRFIELASEVTRSMPAYVVAKVADALNEAGRSVRGSKVLVLGVTYKPNVGDIRESPALDIIELLGHKGAEVAYSDPFVKQLNVGGRMLASTALAPAVLSAADCVVIATHHAAFDYALVVKRARCVVDTRNATRGVRGGARVVKI
jgi:UDP-N-acetyl-D-glucosamine dehydrogenase